MTWQVVCALVACEVALGAFHVWALSAAPGRFSPDFLAYASLRSEGNLGTWFSSMQFAALGAVLFGLWRLDRRDRSAGSFLWLPLAAGAFFLSADEAAMLHEQAGSLALSAAAHAAQGSLLQRSSQDYASFYMSLVYLPVALPAAFVVVRFLWTRLGPYRHLPWLGVALFFLGAVVLDAWEARKVEVAPRLSHLAMQPMGLPFLEEMLEMLGVTVVLAACLLHAADRAAQVLSGPDL